MEKTTRKAVYLSQEQYDEMVEFHRLQQVIPDRVKELRKDQRSKWLRKARNKFKVEEGEGIGLPNGYGLYQKFNDPTNQTEVWKLHVSPNAVHSILNHFHPHSDDNAAAIGAHTGVRATYNKISERHTGISFFDVEEHNKACPICRDNAKIPVAEKDVVPIISHHVNERWVIDTTYLRKLRRKNYGYGYLGVVVDHFSKRVWAFPMKTKSAAEWAFNLVPLILEYDAPRIIHSDNGKEFVNSIIEEIAKIFHIRLVNGGPYQPQQQGIVEKMNDTIKARLATKMQQHKTKFWIPLLDFVVADYNMTPHTVTKFAPFELWNGGRPIQVVHSTKDPISSEIRYYTPEEYSEITNVKRERFGKLQVLTEDRVFNNGEFMKDRLTKIESSKFIVGTHVAIKHSWFKKSNNGKPPKLGFGKRRWPKHGVITEITTKHRFMIRLSNGQMLDKPVSCRVLKLVTSGLADDSVISESESSSSEADSNSDSETSKSSASESGSSSSLNSKSSKSKSVKDKHWEQIKQASASRRQASAIQKPKGMTLTRFYNELANNPSHFSNKSSKQ